MVRRMIKTVILLIRPISVFHNCSFISGLRIIKYIEKIRFCEMCLSAIVSCYRPLTGFTTLFLRDVNEFAYLLYII